MPHGRILDQALGRKEALMTTLHLMPGTQNLDKTTLDRLEAVWRKGQDLRQGRILARRTPPLIRFWDGDWNLKGRLVEYSPRVRR